MPNRDLPIHATAQSIVARLLTEWDSHGDRQAILQAVNDEFAAFEARAIPCKECHEPLDPQKAGDSAHNYTDFWLCTLDAHIHDEGLWADEIHNGTRSPDSVAHPRCTCCAL